MYYTLIDVVQGGDYIQTISVHRRTVTESHR